MTCDRVYRWRLLREEYGPKLVYIKGSDNIVADAISRLGYDKEINNHTINMHVRNMVLAKLCNGYVSKTTDNKVVQTDNVYACACT